MKFFLRSTLGSRDDRFHFDSRERQMFSRAASATTKKPSKPLDKETQARYFEKKGWDGYTGQPRASRPAPAIVPLGDQGDQYGL